MSVMKALLTFFFNPFSKLILAPFQNRSRMSVEHVSPRSVQVRGSNWYLGGARALGDVVGPHSTIISTPGKIDS